MRSRFRTRWVAAAVAVVALAGTAACGSSSSSSKPSGNGSGSAAKPTIRVGYFPDISPVSLMMSQKLLQGMGYNVQYTEFLKGVPQETAAMVGGSVDIIWANTAASLAAFSKAPGLGYLIGQSITNDNMVVVPKGSTVTSIDQLQGKKIATSGRQTSPNLVSDIAFTNAGKDPDNATYVTSSGAQAVTTMQQGAVDAADTYLPFGAQMVLNGGKILVTANQALGAPFPGGGFVARKAFADVHSQAVVDFLKAAIKAQKQLEQKTSADYAALAKFASTSTQSIQYGFEHDLVDFADSMVPNTDALTKVAQAEMKYGFVPSGTDLVTFLKTFMNPTFAQQAQS